MSFLSQKIITNSVKLLNLQKNKYVFNKNVKKNPIFNHIYLTM